MILLVAVTALAPGCAWVGGVASTVAGNFSSPAVPEVMSGFPPLGGARLSVQWVGHSTVLIRMDDRVIVTDPFLTAQVGGIKARLIEPGIDLDSLDRLDIILISHSHADHLSLGSLGMIGERFPAADLVFPVGVEEFLPRYSFPLHRLSRADRSAGRWKGETVTIGGVNVTAVASAHWGGRYGFDGSIWGFSGYTGYIIEYHGLTVYYPGDTGYDPEMFRAIGEAYSIDLALLPIAPCYDPASVGTPNHVGPLGALKILEDSRACAMVPIHYGTVHEPMDPFNAIEVFLGLAKEDEALMGKIDILNIGEQAVIVR